MAVAQENRGNGIPGFFDRVLTVARNDPWRIFAFVRSKMLRCLPASDFVSIPMLRSTSDNGRYVAAVRKAVQSPVAFAKFKRHPDYNAILEHTSRRHGQRYLERLRVQAPEFLERIEAFKLNDAVGRPRLHELEGVGSISPSTLRYMKVAADVKVLFGDLAGFRCAEIGVGYGGQYLVLDTALRPKSYRLFDLRPVLRLAENYLDCFVLSSWFECRTINESCRDERYDLVISNYAFSELPAPLQRRYIDKVLSRSRCGYLTMNSGRGGQFDNGKLSLEELRGLLPDFEVLPEDPLTYEFNYIIVWGHKAEATGGGAKHQAAM